MRESLTAIGPNGPEPATADATGNTNSALQFPPFTRGREDVVQTHHQRETAARCRRLPRHMLVNPFEVPSKHKSTIIHSSRSTDHRGERKWKDSKSSGEIHTYYVIDRQIPYDIRLYYNLYTVSCRAHSSVTTTCTIRKITSYLYTTITSDLNPHLQHPTQNRSPNIHLCLVSALLDKHATSLKPWPSTRISLRVTEYRTNPNLNHAHDHK